MILTLPHILLILPITMKILKFIRVSPPPVYTQQIMVKTITNNQHHPPIHDEGCQNTPENAQNTEIAIAQKKIVHTKSIPCLARVHQRGTFLEYVSVCGPEEHIPNVDHSLG